MSTTAAATTVFRDIVVVDPSNKAVGEQVTVEQFAKGVDLHEFIDGGLAASRPRRAPPRPSHPRRPRRARLRVHRLRRPRRATPHPPRPRRPRRAPWRAPRPRRPRRARLRVQRLRLPRPVPSPATSTSVPLSNITYTTLTRSPTARSAEEGSSTNTPTRCSTDYPSRGADVVEFQVNSKQIKPLSVTIMAVKRKPSTTSIHTHVVFDGMKQRYIVSPTSIDTVGVVPLYPSTKVLTAQKILEVIVMINPIVLDPVPVSVADRGSKSSIHNIETKCISLKPLWSLVSLADDSCNDKSATQICLHCWKWFACGLVKQQPSPTQWVLKILSAHLSLVHWPFFSWQLVEQLVQLWSMLFSGSVVGVKCRNVSNIHTSSDWELTVEVHCVNRLLLVFVESAREVQVLGFCQLNIQFKPPWPPPVRLEPASPLTSLLIMMMCDGSALHPIPWLFFDSYHFGVPCGCAKSGHTRVCKWDMITSTIELKPPWSPLVQANSTDVNNQVLPTPWAVSRCYSKDRQVWLPATRFATFCQSLYTWTMFRKRTGTNRRCEEHKGSNPESASPNWLFAQEHEGRINSHTTLDTSGSDQVRASIKLLQVSIPVQCEIKQELIMIINYWRLSLCLIQFYHQVVDDP